MLDAQDQHTGGRCVCWTHRTSTQGAGVCAGRTRPTQSHILHTLTAPSLVAGTLGPEQVCTFRVTFTLHAATCPPTLAPTLLIRCAFISEHWQDMGNN